MPAWHQRQDPSLCCLRLLDCKQQDCQKRQQVGIESSKKEAIRKVANHCKMTTCTTRKPPSYEQHVSE